MRDDINTILEALQDEGMTRAEAIAYFKDMRAQVREGEADPEELLYEIGLEPDYVMALL